MDPRHAGALLVGQRWLPETNCAGVADDSMSVSADDKTGGRCGRFFGGSAVISDQVFCK
jgi:hypothetical protein